MNPMPSPHRAERQFGLLLAGITVIVGLWPLLDGAPPAWAWLGAAAIGSTLAWRWPQLLKYPTRIWLWLGHQVGRINTWLLLSLVFFLLVTPLALLFRLTGRDLLQLRRKHLASYWHRRDGTLPPDMFRNQF